MIKVLISTGATELIKAKINQDREADVLLKSWYNDQKRVMRDQLIKRHEEIKTLSKKSGLADRGDMHVLEDIPTVSNEEASTQNRACPPIRGLKPSNTEKQIAQSNSQGNFKTYKQTVYDKLNKPKELYIPDDPYKHAEFRGLIHSDYASVVNKSTSNFPRQSRRFSHVSSDFPTPHYFSQTTRHSQPSINVWNNSEPPVDSKLLQLLGNI